MAGREEYLAELLETLQGVVAMIEDREPIDPDLAIARELVEQSMEEVESLTAM